MSITVFTTGPSCQLCRITKLHLTKSGLEFEEVRLDQNPAMADMVRELGFTTSPVVLVGDEDVWDGYRSDAINALASDLVIAAA